MNKFADPRILRGMEKQLRLRQKRISAGEKPIGWKLGFGAPASLERLQLEAPLIGFLTDKILLPSNATVSTSGWVKPALEPEIAVYIGQDIVGNADRESARAAIAAVGPAIELADVDFPPEDVERILAENIYNRHVILGKKDPSRANGMLDGLEAHISQNGVETTTTSDLQALTGDLIDLICYTGNLLSLLGEQLHAGDFVITGSIIPPLWITDRENISYSLTPINTIQVTLQ